MIKFLGSILKMPRLKESVARLVECSSVAFLVAVPFFFWQSHDSFKIWDEGYLWYGVQRVIAGEVPILDFASYDPGRYYFSAAFMKMLAVNGLVGLRLSLLFLSLITIVLALRILQLSSKKTNVLFLVLAAVALVSWIYPMYKVSDMFASVALIYSVGLLLENRSYKKYFLSGLILGMIAFVGRNHGVYGIVGCLVALLVVICRDNISFVLCKRIVSWGLGIVAGFSPIIFMMIFIPGFKDAFIDNVKFLFEIKTTNLPLPVPWPWLVSWDNWSYNATVRNFLIGIYFVLLIVFGVLGLLSIFVSEYRKKPLNPFLVATFILGLPYAHYSFSRSDVDHLALGIFPFLIGSFFILFRRPMNFRRVFLIFLLTFSSAFTMIPFHPGWMCMHGQCLEVKIGEEKIYVDQYTAKHLELVDRLSKEYCLEDEPFLVTPFLPGAYAAFQKKSPLWESFAFFKHSKQFEEKEIERIRKARPCFVLVYDFALDGKEELRYKNTHPYITQYIIDNYESIPGKTDDAHLIVFKGARQ